MVHVRLVCSDPDCAEVFEAFGPLEEVETLVCKCRCPLQVIGRLGEHRGDDRFVALLPIAA
jgi:hypothetical protein